MSDNQAAILAAANHWDAEHSLRQHAKKMTPYRFIRAVQIGRSCPGLGKSCVKTNDCVCVKIAKRLTPALQEKALDE